MGIFAEKISFRWIDASDAVNTEIPQNFQLNIDFKRENFIPNSTERFEWQRSLKVTN